MELLVAGRETEFVHVKVGPAEWRIRNNEENIRRWVAGAAIARAIGEGASVAAGMTVDEVSGAVLEMEAGDWDELSDYDMGDAVEISPA